MKTFEQILAEDKANREKFEREHCYDGYPIERLRRVFEAVEDKQHWKNPWECVVQESLVAVVTAATVFFHADTPEVVERLDNGFVRMRGKGYQAW